jgi:hypothetical protein
LRCEGTRQPLWSSFRNQPRHGQYLVLDPSRIPGHQKGECVVTRPIQPIPTDTTKGVFLFTSLYGHVIVGPTADDSHVREGALPDPIVSAKLYEYAVKVGVYILSFDGLGVSVSHSPCHQDGPRVERSCSGWELGWHSSCNRSSRLSSDVCLRVV